MSVLVVDALNNRGERSTGEGEGDDTGDHHPSAENFLLPRRNSDVAISDRCDGRDGEIEGCEVLLVGAQLKVAANAHPSILWMSVKVGHNHPDATHQVYHNKEGEEEGNQAIKPIFYFCELLKVFKHFVFLLHNFENFE